MMSGECNCCGQTGHVEIEHCAFKDRIDELKAELDKYKTFKSIAHKMYPKRMLIVDGAVGYAQEMKDAISLPPQDSAKEQDIKLRPVTNLPECKWQEGSSPVVCDKRGDYRYRLPCSKRCETPEPKEQL